MSRRGFTLVEILVTIALVVIVTGIVVATFPKTNDDRKAKDLAAQIELVAAGVARYKQSDRADFYQLTTISGDDAAGQARFQSLLKDTRYFEVVPKNPFWNHNDTDPAAGWKYDGIIDSIFPVKP